jgi:hypothetical protein
MPASDMVFAKDRDCLNMRCMSMGTRDQARDAQPLSIYTASPASIVAPSINSFTLLPNLLIETEGCDKASCVGTIDPDCEVSKDESTAVFEQ